MSAVPILMVVPDLFFSTRIASTAAQLGVGVSACAAADLGTRARTDPPRLVLVDLHAPGALDAVRALRADSATRALRVVGFYSHVDQATREAALQAEVTEVLPRSAFTVRLAEILASASH
jgi:CheY-like chemotaxis protein